MNRLKFQSFFLGGEDKTELGIAL